MGDRGEWQDVQYERVTVPAKLTEDAEEALSTIDAVYMGDADLFALPEAIRTLGKLLSLVASLEQERDDVFADAFAQGHAQGIIDALAASELRATSTTKDEASGAGNESAAEAAIVRLQRKLAERDEALRQIAGPSPRSHRPEVEQLRDAVKWRQGVARDALAARGGGE
jgi:hypothetical protein